MTGRRFRGADGSSWTVRQTVPSMAERRRLARRGPAGDAGGNSRARAAERRAGRERRRDAQIRAAVSPGYEDGWLTFECATAKRRLAPVPAGWERLPDSELARLCAQAAAVPRRGRLIE